MPSYFGESIPMRNKVGFNETDLPDPEGGIYMGGSPDLHRAMRSRAVQDAMGQDHTGTWTDAENAGGSNPALATETVDLGGTDPLGHPNTPVKWQGGRQFAQQIDPKIRQQIINEVMGDDSLAPKAMTGTFGGKNFTMTPGRTISQSAANQINARQMRQMEIDRQLASDERRQKNLLEVAALPGKQQIDLENARHANTVSDYNIQHPQAMRDAEVQTAVAGAGLKQAELADQTRDPLTGMTAREKRETNNQSLIPEIARLTAIGTPEAIQAAAKLRSRMTGAPPELADTAGIRAKVSAASSGDLRARAEMAADDYASRSGNILGGRPGADDLTGLLSARDQLAKSIVEEKPGVSPEDAKAEANAVIDAKLRAKAGGLMGGGRIHAARQALAGGAGDPMAADAGSPVGNALSGAASLVPGGNVLMPFLRGLTR